MKRLEVIVWLGLLSIACAALLPNLLPIVSIGTSRLVALQDAAGSCRDDSGAIYVDCGNGTVTDNRTGLVWLKQASCLGWNSNFYSTFEPLDLVAALSDLSPSSAVAAADCGLEDGSKPGEWRMPSAWELEQMAEDAIELGCVGPSAPTITNDEGDDCWSSGNGTVSFVGLQKTFYWTATFVTSGALVAFDLSSGTLTTANPVFGRIWPVRGGQ